MTHRLAACLALASLIFLAPRPAAAATTHTFDTVDAVESSYVIEGGAHQNKIIVTGILVGDTTPTTLTFRFNINGDGTVTVNHAPQCERLAVIAMSRPGKYRFAIGSTSSSGHNGGCKLSLRTP